MYRTDMENLVIRYAKREELESVNKIREQVNEVHVNGRPDIFREDGWPFIKQSICTSPHLYTIMRDIPRKRWMPY